VVGRQYHVDPLFCFVTVDPSGKLTLCGVQSEWATIPPGNPTSKSVGFGHVNSPVISNHDIMLS
jgi:molybdopterin biosynthesis enzyme